MKRIVPSPMASLCSLLLAAFALGYAVSRRLPSDLVVNLALAVPVACGLLWLNQRVWDSSAGGGTSPVLMGGLALLAFLGGTAPQGPAKRLSWGVAPAVFLLMLGVLLHLQSLYYPVDAWRRHAAVSLLAWGESSEGLLRHGHATGYEELLASLLFRGADPLALEWLSAPLFLLCSLVLLSYLCFLAGQSLSGGALLSGLAFLLHWDASIPPLLLLWHGATPVLVSLFVAGLVTLATFQESPDRCGAFDGARILVWFVVTFALATASADLWLALGGLALVFLLSAWVSNSRRRTLGVRLLEALAVWGGAGFYAGDPLHGARLDPVWASLATSLGAIWVGLIVCWAARRWGASRWRYLAWLLLGGLVFSLLAPTFFQLAPSFSKVRADGGWPRMVPSSAWRVARPELGVSLSDIRCAQELAWRAIAGEKVLTNLGSDAVGIAPDSVVVALSGVGLAGWSSELSRAGPTDYERDSLSIALAASARPDLLWNSGISWLLLAPGWEALEHALTSSTQARLEATQSDESSRCSLWRLEPSPSLAVSRTPSQPPFRSRVVMQTGEQMHSLARLHHFPWTQATPYRLQISAFNEQKVPARLGWLALEVVGSQGEIESRLLYLLGATPLPSGMGDLQEVVFVSPRRPGRYTVRGRLLTADEQSEELFRFPLSLSQAPSRDCPWQVESLLTPILELMTGAQTQL